MDPRLFNSVPFEFTSRATPSLNRPTALSTLHQDDQPDGSIPITPSFRTRTPCLPGTERRSTTTEFTWTSPCADYLAKLVIKLQIERQILTDASDEMKWKAVLERDIQEMLTNLKLGRPSTHTSEQQTVVALQNEEKLQEKERELGDLTARLGRLKQEVVECKEREERSNSVMQLQNDYIARQADTLREKEQVIHEHEERIKELEDEFARIMGHLENALSSITVSAAAPSAVGADSVVGRVTAPEAEESDTVGSVIEKEVGGTGEEVRRQSEAGTRTSSPFDDLDDTIINPSSKSPTSPESLSQTSPQSQALTLITSSPPPPLPSPSPQDRPPVLVSCDIKHNKLSNPHPSILSSARTTISSYESYLHRTAQSNPTANLPYIKPPHSHPTRKPSNNLSHHHLTTANSNHNSCLRCIMNKQKCEWRFQSSPGSFACEAKWQAISLDRPYLLPLIQSLDYRLGVGQADFGMDFVKEDAIGEGFALEVIRPGGEAGENREACEAFDMGIELPKRRT
ncbi:hypothetical protein GQ43DRAFT_431839 [Delitschia confertaspora ATCC 74209]|uniref:Uncharacterized protein n=1 Tax=Delitschia confertaspora ATCC 74209 TaxID=1513339 RepID=A0A9P4JL67_9PLEO|nr:hypothetical protein GQ43DRAFT_431839 [Delitschia confertaspora ATCC 74209]